MSIQGIEGALGFEITNCTGFSCDFVLTDARVYSYPKNGLIFDAAGGSVSFSIAHMGARLLSPIAGVIETQRGALGFAENMQIFLNVQGIAVEGDVLGSIHGHHIETANVVGSMSNDLLTLDIIYHLEGTTVYVSLHTLPTGGE